MTKQDTSARYIDLMKKCLTRSAFPDGAFPMAQLTPQHAVEVLTDPANREAINTGKLEVVLRRRHDPQTRTEGRDWPACAETMIGVLRMENLQRCITEVLENKVPGDLLEAGVWRGGATIFMRAMLEVYGDTTRRVWVVDSFQGLPRPDVQQYPQDRTLDLSGYRELAVPLEVVQDNFRKYDLLDNQVRFVKGWFRDTLPTLPVEQLALLRLDGDLYESTILTLDHLYPKLSPGGYVIIDDHQLPPCEAAVRDFRAAHGIQSELQVVDWTGVFWKKDQ